MKADKRFLQQDKSFWANVRTISEILGYTVRGKNQIKIPTFLEVQDALRRIGLDAAHIGINGQVNTFGQVLFDYFQHRADVLNEYVKPRLMNVTQARDLFNNLKLQYSPTCVLPMNKQSKEKRIMPFLPALSIY